MKINVVEWNASDIIKMVGAIGTWVFGTWIAKKMDWARFGPSDDAKVGKVKSETALDIAIITQKKIEDEIKLSNAALQWTITISAQLERANAMIDKKQEVIDKLHGFIDKMKKDFDREFQKLKDDFDKRIEDLENEFEKSKQELITEREQNREEIKRLKAQIDGNR